MRIALLGNAGGGKSGLARFLAAAHGLPYTEIDALLWRTGWRTVPQAEFAESHQRAIDADAWVIDGIGMQDFIESRLQRATHIVLVDMPLWVHFTLAAERQIAWARGDLRHPPAGLEDMPPTAALFETMWQVDRDWMPGLRDQIAAQEKAGKKVLRLAALDQLTRAQENARDGKDIFAAPPTKAAP